MNPEYRVVKVFQTPAELSVYSIIPSTTLLDPIITSRTRETIIVFATAGVDVGSANVRWVKSTIELCGIASLDGVFVLGNGFEVGTYDTTSPNDNDCRHDRVSWT